ASPLYEPDLLAGRRNALHLADLPDLLSLHLLPLFAHGPHATLLDQHGSDGDLHARRRAPAGELVLFAAASPPRALPSRVHAFLLGYCHMVDPDARHPRVLAACPPQGPVDLQPAVLGRGLPPRYVHGRHVPPGRRRRGALPPFHPTDIRLHCTRRLGPDLRRPPPRP